MAELKIFFSVNLKMRLKTKYWSWTFKLNNLMSPLSSFAVTKVFLFSVISTTCYDSWWLGPSKFTNQRCQIHGGTTTEIRKWVSISRWICYIHMLKLRYISSLLLYIVWLSIALKWGKVWKFFNELKLVKEIPRV